MTTTGSGFREVMYEDLDLDRQRLLRAAKKAFTNAYNPYSHFAVGAALLTENGKMITAANVENAAYPSGMCAERSALARANGEGRGFQCIAIAVVALNNEISTEEVTAPCGECRQCIYEAACRSRLYEKFEVILATTNFSKVVVTTIGDLLPLPFGPKDLVQSG
jgi:cytidine deaminase